MQRIIVDYKKLTPELLSLLTTKYPYGYDDGHVFRFKNRKNELIEAVEVRTEDAIYLVKVSTTLEKRMRHFSLDDYDTEDHQKLISELPAPNSDTEFS